MALQVSKAYILKLPDELLDIIIDYARKLASFFELRFVIVREIMLVCRRFHNVALRYLYRRLDELYPWPLLPPSPRIEKLYRSISEQLDLPHFCQSAKFYIEEDGPHPSPSDYEFGTNLLCSLKNLRMLEISYGFAIPATWPMLCTAFKACHQLLTSGSSARRCLVRRGTWCAEI